MIHESLRKALLDVLEGYGVFEEDIHLELERPKDPSHGELSTNVALVLAKRLGRKPRELAGEIAACLAVERDEVSSVEIAGPGFINFRLGHEVITAPILEILEAGSSYGESGAGQGQRVNLEFVSANPTGPLNIVSARAAAVGSALHRAMLMAGYRPHSEFYVNDAGRQIQLLGQSLRARFRQQMGEKDAEIPEGGYQGEYLCDMAKELHEKGPSIPPELDDPSVGRFIGDMQKVEGAGPDWLALPEEESDEAFGRYAFSVLLGQQRRTCLRFGVNFDAWYLESQLHASDRLSKTLDSLRDGGHVYERAGAVWFRSTDFGDEKDRVLVKSGGEPTYFLADIAYHAAKRTRGADRAIDFWGPDHHGHIARMMAAMETLEMPENWLEVVTLQQVNLIQDGKPVEMSKRAGKLVTMDELIDEVGVDVARFFFLARKNASHLDFDLDLAKSESQDNPGWYVKYAHARICSVLRNAEAQGVDAEEMHADDLMLLTHEAELALARLLPEFSSTVARAAESREMSRVSSFAVDLATAFHQFYHQCKILTDEPGLSRARLALSRATRIVLANALTLIGIDAPERM